MVYWFKAPFPVPKANPFTALIIPYNYAHRIKCWTFLWKLRISSAIGSKGVACRRSYGRTYIYTINILGFRPSFNRFRWSKRTWFVERDLYWLILQGRYVCLRKITICSIPFDLSPNKMQLQLTNDNYYVLFSYKNKGSFPKEPYLIILIY